MAAFRLMVLLFLLMTGSGCAGQSKAPVTQEWPGDIALPVTSTLLALATSTPFATATAMSVVDATASAPPESEPPPEPPAPEITLDPALVLPDEQLITLSDSEYGYAYKVPAGWTPADADDHPGGRSTTYFGPVPDGGQWQPSDVFMTMYFAVHHAGKFIPESTETNPYIDETSFAKAVDAIPYLGEGEIKTVGDYTIHILTERDPTVENQELAPYDTTVYILVDDALYLFAIHYAPPGDPNYTEAGWTAYNRVVNTILYSFRVDYSAPYFVNRPAPVPPEVIQAYIEQQMQLPPEPPPPTGTPRQGYPGPQSPLLSPTVTPTGEPTFPPTSPTITTALPPSATPTFIVPVFLTPTADWQPVQVARAIIDIPLGWSAPRPFSGPGGNGVYFGSVDLTTRPAGAPLNEGYAALEYGESNSGTSADAPDGWSTATVDGYVARYTILTDSNFSGVPLWMGVLHIYAPERAHIINLRCTAPAYLGEPRQREFLAYCDSLFQHLVQTTQIID